MPGRPPGLFRSHGSADDAPVTITGWEWLRIFRFVKYKWAYLLTLLLNCAAFSTPYILSIVQGMMVTVLLDQEFDSPEEFVASVDKTSMSVIYAVVALCVFQIVTTAVEGNMNVYFLGQLRTAIFKAIMNQDIAYFDVTDSGVVLSRLQEDCMNAFEAYTDKVTNLVRMMYQFVFGMTIVASLGWIPCLMACCTLPFYGMSQFFGNKWIDSLWLKFNEKSTDVSAKAHEILTSFRTVRSFDAEEKEYNCYKNRLNALHDVVASTGNIHGVKEGLSTITMWSMTSLMFYTIGSMSARGELPAGSVVSIATMIGSWSWAFAGMFSALTELRTANISSAKLMEIVDNPRHIPTDEGEIVESVQGKIEFRNVTFQYPGRQDPALDGLSFTIYPGETVAIVGESGCGKSTTLLMILRFYDPQGGEILVDDKNVKEVRPRSLRRFVSIVPQSPVMFSMSVKENIRYGKYKSDLRAVVSAAEMANAHEFIVDLPNKYKTEVQQVSLSGGQKQRICIARAVMMSTPILLMDEATAALDTENEGLVQDSLKRYGTGRTTIVVAHRLATVVRAQRILVMHKGRIVQTGSHEELIADESGMYAHLVMHQLQ